MTYTIITLLFSLSFCLKILRKYLLFLKIFYYFLFWRNDKDICNILGRRGQAPVSADQGLTLSQQSGCISYVETSAKLSGLSVVSAFETAAIASGILTQSPPVMVPPPPKTIQAPPSFRPPPVPPKPILHHRQPLGLAVSPPVVPPKPRRAISTMALNHSSSSYSTFSSTDTSTCSSTDQRLPRAYASPASRYVYDDDVGLPQQCHLRNYAIVPPPMHHQSQHFPTASYQIPFQTSAISHHNLHSVSDLSGNTPRRQQLKETSMKSAMSVSRNLGSETPKHSIKTTRDKSMLSLLSIRTPKSARKTYGNNQSEKTVTIKCQRLNADKEFEEVDVEVPAPIYETLRFYNDEGHDNNTPSKDKVSQDKPLIVNTAGKKSLASKIKSLFGMWKIKKSYYLNIPSSYLYTPYRYTTHCTQ